MSEFNVAKWFKPKKFIQIVKQTTLYERVAIKFIQIVKQTTLYERIAILYEQRV